MVWLLEGVVRLLKGLVWLHEKISPIGWTEVIQLDVGFRLEQRPVGRLEARASRCQFE